TGCEIAHGHHRGRVLRLEKDGARAGSRGIAAIAAWRSVDGDFEERASFHGSPERLPTGRGDLPASRDLTGLSAPSWLLDDISEAGAHEAVEQLDRDTLHFDVGDSRTSTREEP